MSETPKSEARMRRGRRARTAALVAGGITAAGAALAVAGTSAALGSMLVTPPREQPDDIRILGIDARGVRLARSLDTELPGEYALRLGARIVVLGRIVAEDAQSVTRAIDAADRHALAGVETARWSGYVLHEPEQLGAAVEHTTVPTELGPAPAWIIGDQRPSGAPAETWCIQVHGRGVTRHETLRGMRPFLDRGIPCLAVSYRNDGEAPASRDGKLRLGLDEWRDVEDAIALATARGARRAVLMGWSMGGQIALQVARRSRARRRIAGLVLDSPVVGWRPTLVLQVALQRLPAWLVDTSTWLMQSPAARLSGGRRLDFDELDNVMHADALSQPILLLHSDNDGFVPPEASRELARARPDIVDYREWRTARHTKLWNLDRERYEREIGAWLDARGIGGGA